MSENKKERKLDIFDELSNADMNNKDFYSNLDEDLKKQFSPLVAMRWMSSVSDSSQFKDYVLIVTNEVMNKDFWSLRDHPELQWKLMSLCGVGKALRHQWIPMSKRKKISKIEEFMLNWYPSANEQELNLIIGKLSRDDFEQFVKSTGASDDQLKDLLKAFDGENGTSATTTKKATSKKRKA